MRCEILDGETIHRVEWFTWEPRGERKAFHAVRQARALFDRALMRVEHMRYTNDPSPMQFRAFAMEIGEYLETLRAAADEWLQTPDVDARPVTSEDPRLRSRW